MNDETILTDDENAVSLVLTPSSPTRVEAKVVLLAAGGIPFSIRVSLPANASAPAALKAAAEHLYVYHEVYAALLAQHYPETAPRVALPPIAMPLRVDPAKASLKERLSQLHSQLPR